jgi:hypothetical protein
MRDQDIVFQGGGNRSVLSTSTHKRGGRKQRHNLASPLQQ